MGAQEVEGGEAVQLKLATEYLPMYILQLAEHRLSVDNLRPPLRLLQDLAVKQHLLREEYNLLTVTVLLSPQQYLTSANYPLAEYHSHLQQRYWILQNYLRFHFRHATKYLHFRSGNPLGF